MKEERVYWLYTVYPWNQNIKPEIARIGSSKLATKRDNVKLIRKVNETGKSSNKEVGCKMYYSKRTESMESKILADITYIV